MHVKQTDRELVDEFVRKRGLRKYAPQKGRPQALKIAKGPRRAPRTRK
jgi:hypothetical protein